MAASGGALIATPSQGERSVHNTRPSLAVLPFRQLGGDPRHPALGNALADELIAELARLPRWLLFGTLGSQMFKATLYCASAFGYFTRNKLWGRLGGSLLGLWLLVEQAVLVAVVGSVSLGIVAAAAYGLLTLWVVNVAAKDAFTS